MKKVFLLCMMCLITLPMQTLSAQGTTEPIVIMGYLKVYPQELGEFNSEPKNVISRINESNQYGYGTWRLPTEEELTLIKKKKVISNYGDYMSQSRSSGIVRLVTDREKGESEYVDLGLPSGTKWKYVNEIGKSGEERFTYTDARDRFGAGNLPTKEQWIELRERCKWTWNGNGYKVTGPNGKFITLPANGITYHDTGKTKYVGTDGSYWAFTPESELWVYNAGMYGNETLCNALFFDFDANRIDNEIDCFGNSGRQWMSVRLVKKK